MTKKQPLDEQIISALTDCESSSTVSSVLLQAKARLVDLEKRADEIDNESLSPLLSIAAATTKRQEAADIRFEADRMEASISALQNRLTKLEYAEKVVEQNDAYEKASAEAHSLAGELTELYPDMMAKLIALLRRIRANDEVLSQVNKHRPSGAPALVSAEQIARGYPSHLQWPNDKGAGPVQRLVDMHFPQFHHSVDIWVAE